MPLVAAAALVPIMAVMAVAAAGLAMLVGVLVIFMLMGMLVGVHGFVVMHNSVPFRRRPEKDACQSIFIDCLHYTRTGAICKEHEIGKIIPRGGIETQIS